MPIIITDKSIETNTIATSSVETAITISDIDVMNNAIIEQ